MTDLYFYRDPEAEENKEAIEEQKVPGADDSAQPAYNPGADNWDVGGAPGSSTVVPQAAPSGAPATGWDTDADWGAPAAAPVAATGGDWSAEPATGGDWAADPAQEPTTSGW